MLVSRVTKHSATTVNYTEKGFGGEREIRTLDTLAGIPVFETGAFNHSATSPLGSFIPTYEEFSTEIAPLIGRSTR